MAVTVEGELAPGVSAKDVALTVIGAIGTGGGIGHVIEYRGSAIRSLSMEGRMTLCNMSIEGGARAGLVAPDETTFDYVKGRDHAPPGQDWEDAVAYWRTLATDEGAVFDKEVVLDAAAISPHVTWGTNPAQVAPISGTDPRPRSHGGPGRPGSGRAGPGVHGPQGRAPRCATSPWTRSSSARAPTRGSRTCGPPPPCWTGARSTPACGPWSFPARTGSRPRPRRRGSTRSSWPPGSSGASRAARCAWP